MARRTWLIVVGATAIFAGAALVVVYVCRDPISPALMKDIHQGMSIAEVKYVVGRAHDKASVETTMGPAPGVDGPWRPLVRIETTTHSWHGSGGTLHVEFSEGGLVQTKHFAHHHQSVWSQICSMFWPDRDQDVSYMIDRIEDIAVPSATEPAP